MGRLQSIENALSSINETVFQELCDHFLTLRNKNYSAFVRTGSQSGQQKTIKGTPDSFFLLPNGKYLFIEYSTNKTKRSKKLKEDIEKCIDTSKTTIPANQIAEIVLCINFNLKVNEIEELKNVLSNTRILLSIHTLDSLSIELNLNHRDLASKYLGLPLDTGQIVSIENFIQEYNKASASGISTPINNAFLFRENELSTLKDLLKKTDFVILTGQPGVGKTKLALEAITEFVAENNDYSAHCVSYKHHELLTDLYQHLDLAGNHILFVDDANRIDAINQITGFYQANRTGKLKIILTVRDYTYYEVYSVSQAFNPFRLDVAKFSDQQIIDLIKSESFNIQNPDYHREIVRIADGNPRIAIMAALLAIEKQSLFALADVTDLFEKYFSNIVKDKNELENKLYLKCLGIVAFFYTFPYKEKTTAEKILSDFQIEYTDFIDSIDVLDKLELIEIRYENVKIVEQNLSTYFFYKTFVKDGVLSFNVLLEKYFDTNKERFGDCIIPANNTFGHLNVLDKLRPQLVSHWNNIKTDEKKAENYLSTFWLYLQLETFEFYYNKITFLPLGNTNIFELPDDKNNYRLSYDRDTIIELFGKFFWVMPHLKEALELCLEYVRKVPSKYPELISKIKDELVFDRDDEMSSRFERQRTLFDIIIKGITKRDALLSTAFYDLSKIFLSFHFQHNRAGRNLSIVFYEYNIALYDEIKEFRTNVWKTLDEHFSSFPDESMDVLEQYSSYRTEHDKEVFEFDSTFILAIIKKHLSPSSFRHCKYVQQQVKRYRKRLSESTELTTLANTFVNQEYDVFLKIDWDRLRDKDSYEFDDYKEYERLKEAEIRSSFVFNTKQQVYDFFEVYLNLKRFNKNDWSYNNSLDFIIDENCARNFEIGCEFLRVIISAGNTINFVPRRVFSSQLNDIEKAHEIWKIIASSIYSLRPTWKLSFFDFLGDPLIDESYAKSIINSISEISEPTSIHFERLKRYLKVYPQLFEDIIKEIIVKNENGVQLQVWMDFFTDNFTDLGKDINTIEKLYVLQNSMQNHFDYKGTGLLNILEKDPLFLLEYVKSLYSKNKYSASGEIREMGFVWAVENIEQTLSQVFDFINEKEIFFGILEHFCNSFYRGVEEQHKEKSEKFLLNYINQHNSDPSKMNIAVDILRHSKKELFERFLLQYLTINQKVETFTKIYWRGSGTSGSGNVILADIEAADWRNVLSIVNKSDLGIELLPIRKYLNDKIESCIKSGDWERKQRFLERRY